MQVDTHLAVPRVTLTRPDDWHLHLRDEPYIASVLPHTLVPASDKPAAARSTEQAAQQP